MSATVYMAVAPGGACYVGVTSQRAVKRWRFNLSSARRGVSACKRLAAAIVRYSMTEANFRVLRQCDTLDEAKALERALVRDFKPALNMTKGGDCRPAHTPDSRAKIAAASRGNKHALGHRHSPETRARMSEARLGRRYPNAKSKGARDTSKAVAAAAALRRGIPNQAHAKKMTGRTHSAETRAKMAQSQRARRAEEASR